MLQLGQVQHMVLDLIVFPDKGEARGLREGVYPQLHFLHDALLHSPVHKTDCEGMHLVHPGPPLLHEFPRPLGGAGHQRLLAPVKHEHLHGIPPRKDGLTARVTWGHHPPSHLARCRDAIWHGPFRPCPHGCLLPCLTAMAPLAGAPGAGEAPRGVSLASPAS